MKRKRFSKEQVIGILKEHELGAKTADGYRKHGISDATFYIYGLHPRGKKVLIVV
jgi:putative transposase